MDNDFLEEQQVPSGLLIGIKFDVSTEEDMVSNFFFFINLNAMTNVYMLLQKQKLFLIFTSAAWILQLLEYLSCIW